MIIPPRLNHIFHILLRSNEPISVKELGSKLGVSRRTVFRELQNIDILLKPFKLSIGTINGKGIFLDGTYDSKESLKLELLRNKYREPSGKQERQNRLAIALLITELPQKLFYFSDLLGVSESTISNDLDHMESWFKRYSLILIRKQSYGVSVKGKESCIRRACVSILNKQKLHNQDWGLIPTDKTIEILSRCNEKLIDICSWMTPESFEALELYLLVMLQRVYDGFNLEESHFEITTTAAEIFKVLENILEIKFLKNEICALSLELSGYRNNTTTIPQRHINQDAQLLHLSYQLIEIFDPSIASVLKLDEDLLDGLVFHLKSALIRLENNIELHDPLLEQISEGYQDLMIKSANAARLLVPSGEFISESEISFLAMHFGAALHRLEERGSPKRRVCIGVVCLNGIGTSYILAAQLRKQFEPYAKIEASGFEYPDELNRYDLVISTVPINDISVPVIVVPPFLNDSIISNIMYEVKKQSYTKPKEFLTYQENNTISDSISKLHSITEYLKIILDNFDTLSIESDCTFEELVKIIGYRFGNSEHNGKQIYNGLIQREELSSQIVEELGIALLHCKTDGVTEPVFAVIRPQSGMFLNPYFKNIESCVLMLIPTMASKELAEIMGTISSAMIENEDFLNAIVHNKEKLIYSYLQKILKIYLNSYLKTNWKE